MRLSSIRIGAFRNLNNFEMEISADARLVCLVGANGSGKSNLLNFISGIGYDLGLSPSADPTSRTALEYRDIEVTLMVDEDVRSKIAPEIGPGIELWDGRLVLKSESQRSPKVVSAAGVPAGMEIAVANQVLNAIRQDRELHYLGIDSDRSYPALAQNVYSVMSQAFSTSREDPEFLRTAANRNVRTMYESWLQSMIRRDVDHATRRAAEEREASVDGEPAPEFIDPWRNYNTALHGMLPYLRFMRFSPEARGLIFRSHGEPVTFDQLSSGEQEIAFILGQIERFNLQRGLLLLDEPELHLNAELVRSWVLHLRVSTQNGQVWVATHSLETVEAAGAGFTYVLERDQSGATLATQLSLAPSLQLLSDALGSPAYSAERFAYVFIEGSRTSSGERERYEALVNGDDVKFIEVAGSSEVRHYYSALRALRLASGNALRIGGIVDLDVRSASEVASLRAEGLLVLDCHEIENLFVEPRTVGAIAQRLGQSVDPNDIILDAADGGAGRWCAQAGLSALISRPLVTRQYALFVGQATWGEIVRDREQFIAGAADRLDFHPTSPREHYVTAMEAAIDQFAELRAAKTLWKYYFGKELLGIVPRRVAIISEGAYESAVLKAWSETPSLVPDGVLRVREYVAQVRTSGSAGPIR